MAAPRKTIQPVNTDSGDTTPMTDEEKARVTVAEATPEQTPTPLTDGEQHAGEQLASAIVDAPSNTERVTLLKEAGGHDKGATITVTHGAADYLREQGYVESDDTDEE